MKEKRHLAAGMHTPNNERQRADTASTASPVKRRDQQQGIGENKE